MELVIGLTVALCAFVVAWALGTGSMPAFLVFTAFFLVAVAVRFARTSGD